MSVKKAKKVRFRPEADLSVRAELVNRDTGVFVHALSQEVRSSPERAVSMSQSGMLTRMARQVLLVTILLWGATGVAFAQESSPPNAHDLAIRKVIVDMQLAPFLKSNLLLEAGKGVESPVDSIFAKLKSMPDSEIVDLLVPIYRDQLSDTEAQKASEFLELPVGRLAVAKLTGIEVPGSPSSPNAISRADIDDAKKVSNAGAGLALKKLATFMNSRQAKQETMRAVMNYLTRPKGG